MEFKDIFILNYSTDIEISEVILSEIKDFDIHCDRIINKDFSSIKNKIHYFKKNYFDIFSCYLISNIEVGLYKSKAELLYLNFKELLNPHTTLYDVENHFNGEKINNFFDSLVIFYGLYRVAQDYFSAFTNELNKDFELLSYKEEEYQFCIKEINFFKNKIENQLLGMGLKHIKEKKDFQSIDRDNLIFKLELIGSNNPNTNYYFSVITSNENKIYELSQKKEKSTIIHSYSNTEILQGKLNLNTKRFNISAGNNWLVIKTNEIVNIDYYEKYLLKTGLDFDLSLNKSINHLSEKVK